MFAAIGLGTDVRFADGTVVGGALVVERALVHLVAFPTGRGARPSPRDERRPRSSSQAVTNACTETSR